MRRGRALALLLGITGAVLAMGTGTAAADVTQPTHTILSMQLNGVVDPFTASYIKRGVEVANTDGDAAVLMTIDTPGLQAACEAAGRERRTRAFRMRRAPSASAACNAK